MLKEIVALVLVVGLLSCCAVSAATNYDPPSWVIQTSIILLFATPTAVCYSINVNGGCHLIKFLKKKLKD